jgi:hypothetical protein
MIGSVHLNVCRRWAADTSSGVGMPFGSEENATAILEALKAMAEANLVLDKDTRSLRELIAFTEKYV